MLRALLYLRLTSANNFVLSRLRRLRQPKYLVGAIFGLAYFYFFFFRHASGFSPSGARTGLPPLTGDPGALLLAAGSLALFVLFLCMWIAPSAQPRLNFSEAEISFLFPAPLTRRGLVHYKVLSTQFTALLQSLLYSLLFNSRRVLSGDALFVIIAWWAVLSVITLHYQASSLTIARFAASGVHPARRRLAVFTGLALLLAVTAWGAWQNLNRLPPGLDLFTDFGRWVPRVLNEGWLAWLLWPFRLFVAPFTARDTLSFLLALAPVLGVLALHYLWVVRSNVSFEEAAIARAERQAARIAELRRSGTLQFGAPRTAARKPPFDLARARWPEFAFLWKNLLSTSRPWFTPRNWLICAVVIVGASSLARHLLGNEYWRAGGVLAALGGIGAAVFMIYGPLLSRLDLRQDLAHADLLKTYPLHGWRIILGELLAPIAILTGLIWLALLAWYLGLRGHQPPALSLVWLGPDMRLVFTLCTAVVTPVVVAMELLIPNAVPVLFPGWFQTIRTPGGGIDLMGQRMIFGFGQVFVVLLALVPAALGAALLVFILYWWLKLAPALAVVAATLAVVVVLLGEFWCGLWLLGQRFEKFDLSSEPRA